MHSHLNSDMIQELEKKTRKLQQIEAARLKELKKHRQLERSLKASEDRLRILEQSIAARRQQAQKLEALGALSSGIAHEFNNILAVVLGNCELAQMIMPADAPAQPFFATIATAGNRAKDLVQQILGFSRKQDQIQTPTLIYIVLNEALKFMRASLPATIEFRTDICRDNHYVIADVVKIYQIIVKLCSDAAEAMGEKGGILSVALAPLDLAPGAMTPLGELPSGSYLQLVVADTGKGISPDRLKQLFKSSSSPQPEHAGIGLGLSDIQKIITAYHGAMRVDSEPGSGTTIKIILPIITADGQKKIHINDSSLPTGDDRIQLIDDEPSIVDTGAQFLSQLGYQVSCFSDSLKALDEFKRCPFEYDLVITDMTMPHMTGQVLARQMTALRPDIPIILCSGYSDLYLKNTDGYKGICATVPKPLVFAELAHTVRQVLDA